MTNFTIHTIKSAPEDARPILQFLQDNVGFVPNLAATMANNPLVLETYATLNGTFAKGTLSPAEREIVLMVTSYGNECTYCMAVHSTFARAHGASDDVLTAVRAGKVPGDARLSALVTFAHEVVQTRGQVSAADIDSFLDAGFTKAEALEILIGVIQGTLASLVYKMTSIPLDKGFQPQEWAQSV